MDLGSWKIDDLITWSVTTHNPTNGSGQDADSAPTYHVYEDETSTPLVTGTMALLNGSNTLGFYSEQIQITAALGFEQGKSYNIYVQAVVAGITGTTTRNFQILAEVRAAQTYTPLFTGTLAGIASMVWDELLSGHLTPGSAGYTLFSRMPTGTVIVSQNNDKTGYSLLSPQSFDLIGNISGTIVNVLNVINPVVAGLVTGSVLGNVNGSVNSVTQPVGINTGSFIDAIADGVWDEQLGGHLVTGSAGRKLNDAGNAGDPWSTSLPGLYTPGQAGYTLGNYVDVHISSRMPSGTVTVAGLNPTYLDVPVSSRLASGTFAANYVTPPTAIENADALLKRDWNSVTGEAARSTLNALRFIRNKFSTTASPGNVVVYKEDDTTPAYSKSLTTDASAEPIVEG